MTKKIIFLALLTFLCLAQNAMLRDNMVSVDMMKKMEMDMTMENMEPMAIKNTDNIDMTDIEMMPK
jgi:hypothetical protein